MAPIFDLYQMVPRAWLETLEPFLFVQGLDQPVNGGSYGDSWWFYW